MISNQSSKDALRDWRIVDESLGVVLPDKEPDMNQPPTPSPPPPSPPPLPTSSPSPANSCDCPRASPWTLYAHLPNVQVYLSLGGQYVCRAIGMKCHRKNQHNAHNLRVHLGNVEHQNYNAALDTA
ncbi:uncharacterized protein FMAN_09355 [Fusarium mangiferae]|uniref:Uncharacterized protein n=1 Tax=Fusarium mangiferae TaxID=192010 RepID=A0A1L7SXH7_FUSMA|nr:uncharacterized protein FMAN_09355 [Fusarium mangiferae]CVK91210.1 uncharacterized protein FMAN_09355 [Fusarium mangiferae]